jgi:methionine synthase I (cobalamin-dependent)
MYSPFEAAEQVRVLDGAIGTCLGELHEGFASAPHQASLTEPERVAGLHQAYARAGADAVQANAWLALHLKEAEAERVTRAAADCLDRALAPSSQPQQYGPYRLLSLAPGPGAPPTGRVAFLDQFSRFDAVVLETLIDPWQMAWLAWLAEWSPIPVAASLVPDNRPGTWSPGDFARRAQHLGAKAVGINCGYEDAPGAAAQAVSEMRLAVPRLSVLARPAAFDSEIWLREAVACARAGAHWVGGCCGSGPEDIARLKAVLEPSSR